MPIKPYAQQDFEDFANTIEKSHKQFFEENEDINSAYNIRFRRDPKHHRVLAEIASKDAAKRERGDVMTLAYGPGYRTAFKHGGGAQGDTGWSIRLEGSETGSKYSKVFAPEIFVPNAERAYDIKIRTPLQAALGYLGGALRDKSFIASGLPGKYGRLVGRGSAELGLAGGLQQLGPEDTAYSSWEKSNRPSVSFGEHVANIEQTTWGWLGNFIKNQQDVAPRGEKFLSLLKGWYPYKETETGNVRLRTGALTYVNLAGDIVTEQNRQGQVTVFGGLSKVVKHANVTQSERQFLPEPFYSPNAEGNRLIPVRPEPITEDVTSKAGYRLLNIATTGEQAEKAVVNENVAQTPEGPLSGALIQQNDPLQRQQIVGPFFEKNLKQQIYVPTIYDLARGKFEFGIMKPVRNEQGEVTGYEHQKDAEGKNIPLEGYTIGRDESAIIGTYRMPDAQGNLLPPQPIELPRSNLARVLSGAPKLVVPRAYDVASGLPMNMESEPGSKDSLQGVVVDAKMLQKLRRAAPGAVVENTGMNNFWLSVPYGQEVGRAGKSEGIKYGVMDAMQTIGYTPDTRVSFGFASGARQVDIQAVTGTVKNAMVQWTHGVFGTLSTQRQAQLMTELYGANAPMTNYVRGVAERQQQTIAKYAKGTEEFEKNWEVPTLSGFQSAWKEQTGKEIAPWRVINDMYTRFQRLAQRRPEHVLEQYNYATSRLSQMLPIGTVTDAERANWTNVLEEALKKTKLSESDKEFWRKEEFEFRPTGKKGLSYWYMSSPFTMSNVAAGVQPEFMGSGMASFGPDEVLAMEHDYPGISNIMTGETPRDVKAWNAAQQMYAYQFAKSGKRVTPGEDIATTITEAQTTNMLTKLTELGPNASAEQMEEIVKQEMGEGYRPILRNPKTNHLMITPATQHAIGAYAEDTEGNEIGISWGAKNVFQSFTGFLAGDTYKHGAMLGLRKTLYETFQINSKERMKKMLATFDEASASGRFTGQTGAGQNAQIISEEQMEQLVRGIAKRAGINPERMIGRGKNRMSWREKMWQDIETVGGLPTAFTRDPVVQREGGSEPLMSVTPRMLRARGLDVPDITTVKTGQIKRGGNSLWGVMSGVGSEVLKLLGDWDYDQAKMMALVTADKFGSNIKQVYNQFKGIFNASPEEWEARRRYQKGLLGGRAQEFDAGVKGLKEVIQANENPSEFFDKPTLGLATPIEILEQGKNEIEVKQKMGKSYNARRWGEEAWESSGTYSPQQMAEAHARAGLSYQTFLDKENEERALDKFISSVTPRVEKRPAGLPPEISVQTLSPRNVDEKGNWKFEGYKGGFDDKELAMDVRQGMLTDIAKGYQSPQDVLGWFSTTGEEHIANIRRYDRGENINKILSSIMDNEKFLFSKTNIGKVLQASFSSKLEGLISGVPYRLPKNELTGDLGGREALSVLAESTIGVFGKKETVKQMLEDREMYALRQKYKIDTGKGGTPELEALAAIQQEILRKEQAGLYVGGKETLVAKKMNANQALRDITAATAIEKAKQRGGTDLLGEFVLSPSSIPTLAYKGRFLQDTMERLVAEKWLGIHDQSLYDPEGAARTKSNTGPGTVFHESQTLKIAEELGLKDVAIPSAALGVLTRFGYTQGTMDVGGIATSDDRLKFPELKLSHSEQTAINKVTDERLVRPQPIAYSEIHKSLARQKHAGETDAQFFERTGFSTERELYQAATYGQFLPKKYHGLNAREGAEAVARAKESAGNWWDRLTSDRYDIGVVSAFPEEEVRVSGNTPQKRNVKYNYVRKEGGKGSIFNKFEPASDEETQDLANAVNQTLNEEVTPPKILEHIRTIKKGLKKHGHLTPELEEKITNIEAEQGDVEAAYETQHVIDQEVEPVVTSRGTMQRREAEIRDLSYQPVPASSVQTPLVERASSQAPQIRNAPEPEVSAPSARAPRRKAPTAEESKAWLNSAPDPNAIPAAEKGRLASGSPGNFNDALPWFMMGDERFKGSGARPPGGGPPNQPPDNGFENISPDSPLLYRDYLNTVTKDDYYAYMKEQFPGLVGGLGTSNRRGTGTPTSGGGSKGTFDRPWSKVAPSEENLKKREITNNDFNLALDKLTESVNKNASAFEYHRKTLEAVIAKSKDIVQAIDTKLEPLNKSIKEHEEKTTILEPEQINIARDERTKLLTKKKAALDAQDAAQRELQEEAQGTGIGQDMRKVFGGFGLFYMRTLLGTGAGAWTQPYAEQKNIFAQQRATEQSMYGVGRVASTTSLDVEQQKAIMASSVGAAKFFQDLSTGVSGTNALAGGVGTGIGVSLLANYASPAFEHIGFGEAGLFDKGIAKTGFISNFLKNNALAIGAGAAVAGYIGSGVMDYVTDKRNLVTQGAVAFSGTTGQKLKFSINEVGATLAAMASNNFNEYAEDINWFAGMQTGFKAGTMPEGIWYSKDERARLAQQLSQDTNIKAWQGITQTTLNKTLNAYFAQGGEYAGVQQGQAFIEKVGRLGTAEEAGLPIEQIGRMQFALTQGGYATGAQWRDIADTYLKQGYTDTQIAKLYGAQQLMTETAGMQEKLYHATPAEMEMYNKQFEQTQGRWQDMFKARRASEYALTAGGVTINEADQKDYYAINNFTAAERAAESAGTQLNAQLGSIREEIVGRGVTPTKVADIVGAIQRQAKTDQAGAYQQANFLNRLTSFSPFAIGQLAQQYQGGGNNAAEISQYAVTDFGLNGQMTGLGLFQTGLARPGITATQQANTIWGKGRWESNPLAQAMTFGYNKFTKETYTSEEQRAEAIANGANESDIVGGIRAAQWSQNDQQYALSKQQLGIQAAQVALQEKYQPLFWSMEDRQRALSREQTEWGFGQQAVQQAMQTRQFQENMALQSQQMSMTRSYTQQQWGFQDTTRALQWGWKQEDFAEQSRFMTGRQRRLAERGMERDTTMHNLEEDQIQKQREHQKELWGLEDERFLLQKKQFAEQKEFQEAALAKQRQFYEEGKKLEDESVALTRQYSKEQLALQKASIGVQAQQIELNKKNTDIMQALSDTQDDVMGKYKLAVEEMLKLMEFLIDKYGIGENKAPSGQTPTSAVQRYGAQDAEGGDVLPGRNALIGERGPEILRLGTIGSIVNQYDLVSTMRNQDKWSSRSVFYPSTGGGGAGGGQTINVFIGNEKLASFVIDTVRQDMEVL